MRFLRDDDAQATIEYVLLLSVILGIALLIIRELVGPALKAMTEGISKLIDERLFKPENMHRSPFRAPSK